MSTSTSDRSFTVFDIISAHCDHCGRADFQLYTLFEMTGGHEHEEDVAVCKTCSENPTYTPEYWHTWLDDKFPSATFTLPGPGAADSPAGVVQSDGTVNRAGGMSDDRQLSQNGDDSNE